MNIRSLRVFLPLALLALMLLIGAVSVVLRLQQQQRQLTQEARLSVLTDISRLVQRTNEGMGAALSLVAAEVAQAPQSPLGRTVHKVMPADAAQAIQQATDEAAVSGAVWGRGLALQVPAGQRWFETSVSRKAALHHGSPTFLLILRDITERKETIASLRQLNEAKRAHESQREFLSRMSHELRTPLNAILGSAQLLELSANEPKQQRQVGHILSAGKHLLSLINEILDISRIESGPMTLSLGPVPVAGLVEESLARVRPLAEVERLRPPAPPAVGL